MPPDTAKHAKQTTISFGTTWVRLTLGLLLWLTIGGCGSSPNPSPATASQQQPSAVSPAAETPAPATVKPLATTDTPSLIQKIVITENGEETVMMRRGTQWQMAQWNGYPANQTFVKALIRALTETQLGSPVQVGEEDAAAWGFTADKKSAVFYDAAGNVLVGLDIGKPENNYLACHIRVHGKPDIYLVAVDWFPVTSRPAWADRTLWRMNARLITEFRFQGFGEDLHVRKQPQGDWLLLQPQDKNLSPAFGERFLPSMAWFRSGNIVYDPEHRQLPFTMRLEMQAAGARFELLLARDPKGFLWGKRPGEPVLFQFHQRLADMPATLVVSQTPAAEE